MSSQLTRLADSLALLSARLRSEAVGDDGTLHKKFGGAVSELLLLREVIAQRISRNDPRGEDLRRVDAALAELAAIFNALPRAPHASAPVSRPLARRRQLRAVRLDAATRRLLRRVALVLGLSGAGAVAIGMPLAAVAGSCVGTNTVVCTGSFVGGIIFGSPATTLTVEALTAAITPASGTGGIVLDETADGGSGGDFGDDGDDGEGGPSLALNANETTNVILTTGDSAQGIYVHSAGGSGGSGGDGAVGISPGSGGNGGVGGAVNATNMMGITTEGANAAGVWALSQGGNGGKGGDDYVGSGGADGGAGGDAGTVNLTNHGRIETFGTQSFSLFGESIGGNGGEGGGSNGSFRSAGSGGGANTGNTVTIDNDGVIVTHGDDSHGIFGESVGGFAGSGGSGAGLFGWGGSGSTGGDAGAVDITNSASVTTYGVAAYGIFAQSVGGGGGNGGSGAGIVGLGASGAIGGSGAAVSVNNSGTIEVFGDDSRGIFAQSIGGGGGNGGEGAGISGIGGSGSGTSPGGDVSVTNSGSVTTHGLNGYAIEAQSIGGGGGDGGTSIGLITIGGSGGAGGDAGAVTVDNSGALSTVGTDSAAIFAQAVGGGGGNGGNADAAGAFISFALGGSGGPGGAGGAVEITSDTSTITTTGARSDGIEAQSVGGGGGNGGYAISASAGPYFSIAVALGGAGADASNASTVNVTNSSVITTSGDDSLGIMAQSIGGGGGNGGLAIAAAASNGVSGTFAMGGSAGGGGDADTVTLSNDAAITTSGFHADGILAESIGGGGGNGGLAVTGAAGVVGALGASVGGSGGGGGVGADVSLTSSGLVTTSGDQSFGVLAQSVGGGGGNGGGAVSGAFAESAAFSLGIGGSGDHGGASGTVDLVNDGGATTTGDESDGVVAQSIGGGGGNGGFSVTGTLSLGYAADVSIGGSGKGGGDAGAITLSGDGTVTTSGFDSDGIVAQSIGGGGGDGGFSVAGTIAKDAAGTFAVGGSAGGGGGGGAVTLDTGSSVTTAGDDAFGILAQSVGGGGGTGGFAVAGQISGGESVGGITFTLGGVGGAGRDGGTVDLTSTGTVSTGGDDAYGVVAQSIGGGGGDGGFSGSFLATFGDGATASLGIGGNGGTGGSGGTVHTTNSGAITTTGDAAYGLLAQSIGGGGGDGGWGMSVTASGGESTGTLVGAVGGNGGTGGLGGDVFVNNSATVITSGSDSYGILAQSVGGGGGNGGFAASGAFSDGPDSKMLSVGVGGKGGSGNDAGDVTVTNTGQISTTGAAPDVSASVTADTDLDKQNAVGILAQSIGGGGGNGGASYSGQIDGPDSKNLSLNVGGFGGAGGSGGSVQVTNQLGGDIETDGAFGYGIEAQSIGGGGGNGGMALSAILSLGGEGTNANVGVSIGGEGGDGNSAADVTVNNDAGILTRGVQSAAILAQSIGGGGGTGGSAITAIMGVSSVDPNEAMSRTVNVAVAVGGLGGDGSNGGAVVVDNTGALITWGDQSQGINAQSIGGGGGIGGNANTISLIVGAQCSLPVVCSAPDNAARNLNLQATVGGNGGGASDGGTVDVVNSAAITTHGEGSDGIFAQSIGGGGGSGGNGTIGSSGLLPVPLEVLFIPVGAVKIYQDISVAVGGNSGSSGNGAGVTIDNSGAITTLDNSAIAIDAQSVGGGGGVGGAGAIGLTGKIGIGGAGGAGGNGGTVGITNSGALATSGIAADGIFAQSVGGGGGRAGNVNRGFASLTGSQYAFGVGLAFGQDGGDGGDGGAVTVDNSGSITTAGGGAIGIFAQSVGGGGGQLGDIGNGDITPLLGGFVGSVGDKGDGGAVTITQRGDLTTSGDGAAGIFAQSAGGQGIGALVSVNLTGNITTHGQQATGLMAQSVGLNGSNAVSVTDAGNITTTGDNSTGMTVQSFGAASADGTTVMPIAISGFLLPFFVSGGAAGAITISQSGTTTTSGVNSHGILAQSVSSLGTAGNVSITYDGSITATGLNADGIVAQSTGANAALNGNITITINGSGTVSGGGGTGAAVRFIDGANNTLTNYGTLTTAQGLTGVTVVGGAGNDDFENYGTLAGTVALGGGTNQFNNHVGATILAGPTLDMGGRGNTLANTGTFSPGGPGAVLTTSLNGSYLQTTTGVLNLDVDFASLTADRLNASGTADLSGRIDFNFDNVQSLRPGTTQFTVVTAAGGITNSGVTLDHPDSAIVHYALAFPDANDATLSVAVNFAPPSGPGINANDIAIGGYINTLQTVGSSAALAPFIEKLFTLPDTQSLHDFYQSISPAAFLADHYALSLAGSELTDAMLSCHPETGGDFRFTEEDECSWLRVSPGTLTLSPTAASMGAKIDQNSFAMGHQFVLDEHFRAGVAGSYTQTATDVETTATSQGEQFAGGVVLKALYDPAEAALAVTGGTARIQTARFVNFPNPGVTAGSTQRDTFLNERLRVSLQGWGEENTYLRPFAEFNATQLTSGGFAETGAGPLDLIVGEAHYSSGNTGLGLEFGGEIRLTPVMVVRPFASYEAKDTLWGQTQNISASFEGAPAGIAPFTVSDIGEKILHQVNAGLDIIGNQNVSARLLYTGTYGAKTRDDLYSVKIIIPF